MQWNLIHNPETGTLINIHSQKGKRIINRYIEQLGGHAGPCAFKTSTGRCSISEKWDHDTCKLSAKQRCKIKKKSTKTPSTPKSKPKPKLKPKPKSKSKSKKTLPKPSIPTPTPPAKVEPTPTAVLSKTPSLPATKAATKSSIACPSGRDGAAVYNVGNSGVLLAKAYKAQSVDNWWVSEKWDGYRAVWNGNDFVSRAGKRFDVPNYFKDIMPPGIALDGELWRGRGEFEGMGLVRRHRPKTQPAIETWIADWKTSGLTYNVFDILNDERPFEDRMATLEELVDNRNKCMSDFGIADLEPILSFTEQTQLTLSDALVMAKTVIEDGGEGVMLRKPSSIYVGKRSSTLLKIKEMADMEAVIIGYKMGTGKYEGKLGSFECSLLDNSSIVFYTSGMTDSVRDTYILTHPIGTIITITYNGLTGSGKPRHPRYLRIRHSEGLD